MVEYTFHPLTLNQHFGTLIVVWVVPLSRQTLTTCRRFLKSMTLKYFELDRKPRILLPKIFNPCLYHFNYLLQDLTTANFGRNQLLPDSIGFSPLTPNQKNACPQHLFRPPLPFESFTLSRVRSSGFGY